MYVVYIGKWSSAHALGASVVRHHSLPLMNSFNKTEADCCFLVQAFFTIKLMKGKALRKHSLHQKPAASVLLNTLILFLHKFIVCVCLKCTPAWIPIMFVVHILFTRIQNDVFDYFVMMLLLILENEKNKNILPVVTFVFSKAEYIKR